MQRCKQSQEISRLPRATVFCLEQLCGRRLGQNVQGWRAVRRDAPVADLALSLVDGVSRGTSGRAR